ncbi:hypothetical protein [Peteryoungia ipomoeae]|uniref:Uncharacterized protein n=1 Tax=Peteryoungia ipomoeae TaxID=1210932 RepID=A0A4S8NWS1_9HYPH|nr:hypothetical protein [Peteryoungia ipomoeae]THV21365.1 hypothetical protein FAA97_15205 [Peteryoungia ipomoeae]
MEQARTTWLPTLARFTAGYAAAVFVGVMGIWTTLEISDAITLGRLPLFILIFPDQILNAVRLTVQVMPESLLLAAPFTALATWVLIRMRWNRWWHFAIAGAACPLSGIILVQLASWGRFFHHNEAAMALILLPTGMISALIYWLIAVRPLQVLAR